MNIRLVFFIIGFVATAIGFAVGYFSGQKMIIELTQSKLDEKIKIADLLRHAANSPTITKDRRAEALSNKR